MHVVQMLSATLWPIRRSATVSLALKVMLSLDARKFKEHRQQPILAIQIHVLKMRYVLALMELPNVRVLHRTWAIPTIPVAGPNVYSTRIVLVRWPVSINIVGILVQVYVAQMLNVSWQITSQFANAAEVLLVIHSKDAEETFRQLRSTPTHATNAHRIAFVELYKVVQRARVPKDIAEHRQHVGQNVQATKNVPIIKAVSTSNVRIHAQDYAELTHSVRSSTTNRSAVVYQIITEIHSSSVCRNLSKQCIRANRVHVGRTPSVVK